MPKKNYGFKPGHIKKLGKRRHWQHGDGLMSATRMQGEDIFPNGHGQRNYLLDFEPQSVPGRFDSMGCFCYGTAKAFGTYIKRVYPGCLDTISKRFPFILSGGSQQGGSPHYACEIFRTKGWIRNSLLNISTCNSWFDWAKPKPMTSEFLNEGLTRTRYWVFHHDWLFSGSYMSRIIKRIGAWFVQDMSGASWKANLIKDNLRNYVLAVSVNPNDSSYSSHGIVTKIPGSQDTHWLQVFEYEDGRFIEGYDDYEYNKFIKFAWDYDFGYCKRIWIERKDDVIADDAKYIINTMIAKNVKGDLDNTVYFIFNGEKLSYPSMDVFNEIQDRWNNGDKTIITVAQEPLDAIPVGSPRSIIDIENAQVFFTPDKP